MDFIFLVPLPSRPLDPLMERTLFYCRPLRKLQEGNIFIRVCLFTGGTHVTITYDALDLTDQATP